MSDRLRKFRRKVYRNLEPTARRKAGLSHLNLAIAIFVVIATIVSIIETEPLIFNKYSHILLALDAIFIVLLSTEFLFRMWVAAEGPGPDSATMKRLKFVFSFYSLIDLLVIFSAVAPFIGFDLSVLRIIRLFRLMALAKLGRISLAMRQISLAIYARRFELWLTVGFAVFLLVIGATLLYWAEGDVQPDKFGSIPRALWWSMATLTTVGYGDVAPITPLGKFLASLTAVIGIGLVALPTGILASAFSEALQEEHRRARERAEQRDDE